MVFLGPECRLDIPAEKEALIFIESFLAKESKMLCSAAYSFMILEGASSSESLEWYEESDIVGRLWEKMRCSGRKMRDVVEGRCVTCGVVGWTIL
jgi:hypothetical protein